MSPPALPSPISQLSYALAKALQQLSLDPNRALQSLTITSQPGPSRHVMGEVVWEDGPASGLVSEDRPALG